MLQAGKCGCGHDNGCGPFERLRPSDTGRGAAHNGCGRGRGLLLLRLLQELTCCDLFHGLRGWFCCNHGCGCGNGCGNGCGCEAKCGHDKGCGHDNGCGHANNCGHDNGCWCRGEERLRSGPQRLRCGRGLLRRRLLQEAPCRPCLLDAIFSNKCCGHRKSCCNDCCNSCGHDGGCGGGAAGCRQRRARPPALAAPAPAKDPSAAYRIKTNLRPVQYVR